MLYQRRNFGEHPIERFVAVRDGGQQLICRVDRPGEASALAVQFSGECVYPREEFADLVDVTVQDREDLGLNEFEVRDAAAVEDNRDAG